ncbi:MAG: PQQ-dependent sugar dehydrogenase [Betaproteobacteria bacterium]|nr:PQQ-dependent sugar dehydrogenase [Betaproteobacteria bacterium]
MLLRALFAGGLFFALWPALAPAAVPVVSLRQVVTGLSAPVEVVNAGDGSNRLFIVEQLGRIRIVENGVLLATPFLDIQGIGIVATGGELGLLGLAFHPDYANNGAFYIYYTRQPDRKLVLARVLRNSTNANLANAASRTEVLVIDRPPAQANHNGGHLAFGPDGYLYMGTGDGGGGGDPQRTGLNLAVQLGKLLRISVDGGTGYSIPPSNPYAAQTCATACPEIWAYGLRNPWKFSFDRVTGDLFIGDVGQGSREEVNWLPRGTPGPVNFGWGAFEGELCYNNNYFGPAGACAAQTNHRLPIITYDHGASGGVSITGGYRYRGTRHAELEGHYLYGDYGSRRIWAARRNANDTWATELLIDQANSVTALSSFGEDEAGEMYVLDYGNGRLMALDGPPLAVNAAASRMSHAGAGSFDLTLARGGLFPEDVPIEPRVQGDAQSVQITFNAAIASAASVRLRNAAGQFVSDLSFGINGAVLTVNVPAFSDGTRWLLEIDGLNGTGGSLAVPVGYLQGDVGATGLVSAADIVAVKQQVGIALTPTNARFDLNRSGALDSSDLTIVRGRSGMTLQ